MRLLVGVTGSARSLAALDTALERARDTGDDLTVAVLVDATDADDALVDRVRDRLQTAPVEWTLRTLTGDPAPSLVEFADADRFDRLLVAGGDRSPLGKVTLDSFTEFVLLNATTTLTLVR